MATEPLSTAAKAGNARAAYVAAVVAVAVLRKVLRLTRRFMRNCSCRRGLGWKTFTRNQIHPRKGYLSTAFPGNFSLGSTNLERFLTEPTPPAVSCFGCTEIVYPRGRSGAVCLVEEINEAFLHT